MIPQPVVPSADGLTLVPYTGPDADRLTVGGELNKLAANVAMGRNFGGIHWRTDYVSSIFLGEELAIRMLMDLKLTYNEDFDGFTFTKFDGTQDYGLAGCGKQFSRRCRGVYIHCCS